jgi:hypothetical protein
MGYAKIRSYVAYRKHKMNIYNINIAIIFLHTLGVV